MYQRFNPEQSKEILIDVFGTMCRELVRVNRKSNMLENILRKLKLLDFVVLLLYKISN